MVVYKRTKNLTKYNRDASDSHHQCIILRGPIGAFKKLSRCINTLCARGGVYPAYTILVRCHCSPSSDIPAHI